MKRITFITGHYGSGKSEVATNLAIIKHVDMIIDLDIVNPYFRSRELETVFNTHGIKLVGSPVANSLGSDLPFISSEIMTPFIYPHLKAVYDLGGDAVGARLLRQFSLNEECDLLLCINIYRDDTSSVDKIIKMIDSIEAMGGAKITGLINNTNLIRNTTIDDIIKGEAIIKQVSEIKHLDIKYTTVNIPLKREVKFAGELLEIELYLRKKWL